jgi:hypothetical protein
MDTQRVALNCVAGVEVMVNKETGNLSMSIEAAKRSTSKLKVLGENASRAMKLARHAVVNTQIQHMRIQRMGQSLRAREAELVSEELHWVHQSKVFKKANEQKSLDCLANRVRCRVRLTNVRERLLIHDALELEMYLRWEEAEVWLEKLLESSDNLKVQADAIKALLTLTEKADSGGLGSIGKFECEALAAAN